MKNLSKFRIIPLLMVVAGLSFTVRVGEFVTGLGQMGSAVAAQDAAPQEVNEAPPPITAGTTTAAQSNEIPGRLDLSAPQGEIRQRAEPAPLPDPVPPAAKGEAVEWKDPIDNDIASSEVRQELVEDLAKRREQLDKKEKEIAVREALLSAAERELDQKLGELTGLKTEIEAMMVKRSQEEEARIASLVKIYEGMKPKDAASIFNTLDLDVLIVIMTKMSERKSSPILAEMNAERARTVTIMMAEQKQTPALPTSN